MIIVVLPQARLELVDALSYYEGLQHGLGSRLWEEVNRHIVWIAQNHGLPRERPGGYRRINLRTFPYYMAYITRADKIWVLAIAHAHRQPEYWIERMKDTD